MKPDDPTITALGQALNQRKPKRSGLGIIEEEWELRRWGFRQKNPFPDPVFTIDKSPCIFPA